MIVLFEYLIFFIISIDWFALFRYIDISSLFPVTFQLKILFVNVRPITTILPNEHRKYLGHMPQH